MASAPPLPGALAYHSPDAPQTTASTDRVELSDFVNMLGLPTQIDNSIAYSPSASRPRFTLRTSNETPLLRAIVAAAGAASLVSVYYAYTRYCKYRVEQQLQNLSWSVQRSTAAYEDQIVDQIYLSFDDVIRAGNRAGYSPLGRQFWQREVMYLLSNPKQRGLLAVDDRTNEVIGSVYGDESDDGIVPLGPFSVLTKYANHSIARALVQQLIDECLQSNPRRVLILTQSPSNMKAFALYSKLGFSARYSLLSMKGWVSKPANVPDLTGIEVKRFTHSDVDEADELLQTTLSGISRGHYMNNMLNPEINTYGIGYVARNKSDQQIVGFTTSANSAGGLWCYRSLEAFQALYVHASNDLQTYNNEADYKVGVYLPQMCYTEFRWLLSVGVKLTQQMNLLIMNELTVRDGYRYCPSAFG